MGFLYTLTDVDSVFAFPQKLRVGLGLGLA